MDSELNAESATTRTLVAIAERRKGALDAARCRLVFAHLDTAARLRCSLRGALARHELSDLQFAALVVLFTIQPEPISTAVLAQQTDVSRSAMTDALDKLEAHRFATRTRDDRDRRIIYVRITAAGRGRIDQAIDDYLCTATHAAHYLEELKQAGALVLGGSVRRSHATGALLSGEGCAKASLEDAPQQARARVEAGTTLNGP